MFILLGIGIGIGIAEVQIIYSARCYIQRNIQKVTIAMQ